MATFNQLGETQVLRRKLINSHDVGLILCIWKEVDGTFVIDIDVRDHLFQTLPDLPPNTVRKWLLKSIGEAFDNALPNKKLALAEDHNALG